MGRRLSGAEIWTVSSRRRRHLLRAVGALPAATLARVAPAQTGSFPSRPIRLICPWPPAGPTDTVMRAIAESAARALGGTIVVDNKAGASGMLGPIELVNANPDGYTLSQITVTVTRLPRMQKIAFDPLRDFTFIAKR